MKPALVAVSQIIWDSPAFKAGITEGAQILAINGTVYDADVLKDSIRSAKDASTPLELIVKIGDRRAGRTRALSPRAALSAPRARTFRTRAPGRHPLCATVTTGRRQRQAGACSGLPLGISRTQPG